MRRLLALLPLLLFLSARPASAQLANAQGWCESGATVVISSGLQSTNQVQGSFPSCTVSVSIHGGGTATIYSTGSMTPLSNPFTAQSNGRWLFYAANGEYDITMTGGGLTSPVTYSDVWITNVISSGGGGGTPCVTTANSIQYNNGGVFGCAQGIITPDGNSLIVKGPSPLVNLDAFARISNGCSVTATISLGAPTTATLSASTCFQNGDGITIYGAGASSGMSTPSAPTVTPASISTGGTGLGGGPGASITTVAGATSASTYSYEIIARDKFGGITAPSSATTITNGLSSLATFNCPTSSITRSGQNITVNFSSPCEGAVVGAAMEISGNTQTNFFGFYNIATVNSSTQVVATGPYNSSSFGWQHGDDVANSSSNGEIAYFISSNHIAWTTVTNAWEYYICAERPGDSSFKLIGVTKPNISSYQDIAYDDYGSPFNDGQLYPVYMTNANCNGGAASPDPLTTTVSAGGGTTTITLANAATTAVSGATSVFDDGPGLVTAANTVSNVVSAGLRGEVYIPPTSNSGGSFIINSFTVLPGTVKIRQAGTIILNETVQVQNGSVWDGTAASAGGGQFGYTTSGGAVIDVNRASPGIYISADSVGLKNLNFNEFLGNNNGMTFIVDDANHGQFENIMFNINGSTNDYLSMAVVLRGASISNDANYTFDHLMISSSNIIGAAATWTPFIYASPAQSGGVYVNQQGYVAVRDASLSLRGLFQQTGSRGGINWYIENLNRQGGVAPLLWVEGLVQNENIFAGGILLDTDSSGFLSIGTNTGSSLPDVRLISRNILESNGTAISGTGPTFADITGGTITRLPNNNGSARGCVVSTSSVNVSCNFGSNTYIGPNANLIFPLGVPSGLSASVAAGGSLASGIFQVAVTAVGMDGKETTATSNSANVTTSGTCPGSGNCEISISWTPVPYAATYNVYACGIVIVPTCANGTNQQTSGLTSTSFTLTSIVQNGITSPAFTQSGQSFYNLSTSASPSFLSPEGTAPSGKALADILYGDSTAHRWKQCNNNTTCDTVVGAATTDTLTHKTYDTAGTGNVLKINGNQVSAVTGNTSAVQLQSGATTTGDAVKFDANGNTVDAGFAGTLIICTGQIALTTGAIGSGARATNTLSCSGLSATTDSITCTFSGDTNAVTGYAPSASGGLSLKTWASTNTINVDQVNDTGGSITPGAATINCKGIR